MDQKEATDALTATYETLVVVGNETDALIQKVKDLEKALADAIAAGNTITPELEAAVKAVAEQAKVVDDKVPELAGPPPGQPGFNPPPRPSHPDTGIPRPEPQRRG